MSDLHANFREMISQTGKSSISRLSAPRRTLAADVSRLVARKLKSARKDRGYSLDALAKASGVSRAMLGQIETGKSVPTITVMWRIADALGVPVAELISQPEAREALVLTRADSKVSASLDGRYVERPLAEPNASSARFFELRIEPRKTERTPARGEFLSATIIVAHGTLDVQLGPNPPIRLNEGDMLLFDADCEQTISNAGQTTSIAYLALTDKRSYR